MGQFLEKIANLTLLIVLGLSFALLPPLSPENTLAASNDQIECIIVKNSGCPACDAKYLDFIEPFYEEYRDNESIDFIIFEATTDITILIDLLDRINLTLSDLSILPSVIFVWGNDQKQVLDGDNLELINDTFQNISEDIDYQPGSTDNDSPLSTDIIRIDLLLLAIAIVLSLSTLTVGGGYFF